MSRLRAGRAQHAAAELTPPKPPANYRPVRNGDEAGSSLLEQFSVALRALRGHAVVVADEREALAALMEILQRHEADSVIGWAADELPLPDLPKSLAAAGVDYRRPRGDAVAVAQATVGISGAEALLAATGSVVVRSGAGRGRIPTVLAPVYVVLAHEDQLLPHVEAWVEQSGAALGERGNICFISGPSKTADIEMTLVHGVHGPGEVHVIILRNGEA